METANKKMILITVLTKPFMRVLLDVNDVEVQEFNEGSDVIMTFKTEQGYGSIERITVLGKNYYEIYHKSKKIVVCSEAEYWIFAPFYVNDYVEYFSKYEKLRYIKMNESHELRMYFSDMLDNALAHFRKMMSDDQITGQIVAKSTKKCFVVRIPEADLFVFKDNHDSPADKSLIFKVYKN